jgi:hypothetical protein
VNDIWSTAAHYVSRYRGALLGGIGSAVAVAMTLDPSTGLASSSIRFAFWFAAIATGLAVGLTGVLSLAEYRASRPVLPRAVVHRPSRSPYDYN